MRTAPPRFLRSFVRPIARVLRRHPIACLLLLTPGIPEYLSGSSSVEPLVRNPPVFFLFLGLNLALYGPGVLLVREATVRWRTGWGSVVLLGTAYAIAEEGLAVDTFFDPNAGPVGALGSYGHWLGVSWVWVAGIVMVHVVYSLSLPILLHAMALPETRGRSLLSDRGVLVAIGTISADVLLLQAFVSHQYHYWYGTGLLVASLGAILGLIGLARALPPTLLRSAVRPPRFPRWVLFLVGGLLLPGTFLVEAVRVAVLFGPTLMVLALAGMYGALLAIARAALGRPPNERGVVAFAAGALVPLMVFGLVANIALPIVIGADGAAVVFLVFLWRKYPDPMAPGRGEALCPPPTRSAPLSGADGRSALSGAVPSGPESRSPNDRALGLPSPRPPVPPSIRDGTMLLVPSQIPRADSQTTGPWWDGPRADRSGAPASRTQQSS